jgi:hypothetical protein
MARLLRLDFVTERLRVGWDEISAEDVRGLDVLKQERDRRTREMHEEAERNRPKQ